MSQYFSPHISITDRINYLYKCVYVCVVGGVKVKWAAKTIPSMQPAQPAVFKCLLITWTTFEHDIWHLILWDHIAVCPDLAWICLQCVWCYIYVNLHLDYISRSPSLVGITVGIFHPGSIEIKLQCDPSASELDDSVANWAVNTCWCD